MTQEKAPHIFVYKLDPSHHQKMISDLKDQNFEINRPDHTFFSAKKKGVCCTFYQSGKLTVQGKEALSFIEFYLEPEILKTFHTTYKDIQESDSQSYTPHIGIDESGKGDFFGPLCIAGVFATEENIRNLKYLGVKDSKTLDDKAILLLGKKIKNECTHQIVKINPLKYNELYDQFQNLNKLLAWGHATTIENLVIRTGCKDVTIDQFASEHVVISALNRKKLHVNLTQRHRGEEDIVVAAASILARETFVEGLEMLKKEIGFDLPKGASKSTIKAGKEIYKKYGIEGLKRTGKLHFKTLQEILNET